MVAVPGLLTFDTVSRVLLVITDGDSQECTQLDSAIQLVFTNAKRRRCSWHAVFKGFERKVGSLGAESSLSFKVGEIICRRLHQMTTSVETLHEYQWYVSNL